MVNVLDCGIVVTEFELQLRGYIHLRKRTNPFIPVSYPTPKKAFDRVSWGEGASEYTDCISAEG